MADEVTVLWEGKVRGESIRVTDTRVEMFARPTLPSQSPHWCGGPRATADVVAVHLARRLAEVEQAAREYIATVERMSDKPIEPCPFCGSTTLGIGTCPLTMQCLNCRTSVRFHDAADGGELMARWNVRTGSLLAEARRERDEAKAEALRHAQEAIADFHRTDDALTDLAALRGRVQRLEGALEPVRRAGGLLANCAFNLAQRDTLDERARRSLKESQEEWDKALAALHAALADTGGVSRKPLSASWRPT